MKVTKKTVATVLLLLAMGLIAVEAQQVSLDSPATLPSDI